MKYDPNLDLNQHAAQVIINALFYYKGRVVITARALGIAERTLERKLERAGFNYKTYLKKIRASFSVATQSKLRDEGGLPIGAK